MCVCGNQNRKSTQKKKQNNGVRNSREIILWVLSSSYNISELTIFFCFYFSLNGNDDDDNDKKKKMKWNEVRHNSQYYFSFFFVLPAIFVIYSIEFTTNVRMQEKKHKTLLNSNVLSLYFLFYFFHVKKTRISYSEKKWGNMIQVPRSWFFLPCE